jgi:NAD(P)-dependent dehydrogenase (short-subunit alcohol dehydrogenase family)
VSRAIEPGQDGAGGHSLAGQHALITGGGSGIGLACARAFLVDGARVTIAGRSVDKLETARAELATVGDVRTAALDVADEMQVGAAIDAAHAWAPLTIAVANAGLGGLAPLTETLDADWQKILQTNLTGTFYTFKHAARVMQASGSGALCAISSIAAVRTHRFMHAYVVSKAGIDMLVRNTADELGAHGIRVNSVCPGLVDTELAAGLFATEPVLRSYHDNIPLGHTGEPVDIARAVRFLCGPESSWITGTVLSVDGGQHLRRGPDYDTFIRAMYPHEAGEGKS